MLNTTRFDLQIGVKRYDFKIVSSKMSIVGERSGDLIIRHLRFGNRKQKPGFQAHWGMSDATHFDLQIRVKPTIRFPNRHQCADIAYRWSGGPIARHLGFGNRRQIESACMEWGTL